MVEKDPGVGGPKLSKSGSGNIAERNKSYEKVLDTMIEYVKAKQAGLDTADDLLVRWEKKSVWHLKEYGW